MKKSKIAVYIILLSMVVNLILITFALVRIKNAIKELEVEQLQEIEYIDVADDSYTITIYSPSLTGSSTYRLLKYKIEDSVVYAYCEELSSPVSSRPVYLIIVDMKNVTIKHKEIKNG